MTATVIKAGKCCTLCHTSDHVTQDCALASSDHPNTQQKASSTKPRQRPKPYPRTNEACLWFNRGTCAAAACKYSHVCTLCKRPSHGAHKGKRHAVEDRSADLRNTL